MGLKTKENLQLIEKINIIKDIESGKKQVEVATSRNVPRATVCRIWRERDKLSQQFVNENSAKKTIRALKFDKIDAALLDWFEATKNQNLPVNGPALILKAKEFAGSFGQQNEFKASSGWLDKWVHRHRVKLGKAAGVVDDVINDWFKNKWPFISEGYNPRDIFTCDEAGLFYGILPNGTYHFKDEVCVDGNYSRERITVLFCCNSDGSEKRKPLVIGKSKNPGAFKKIKEADNLPVDYCANETAWMTAECFIKWLQKFDNEMGQQSRKILLILDNAACHQQNIRLRNIKLAFLPPNSTCKHQPLNRGIIKNVKARYRSMMVCKILQKMDQNLKLEPDLLEAVLALNLSWNQLLPQTISTCFSDYRMIESTAAATEMIEEEENEFLPVFIHLQEQMSFAQGFTMEDYIHIDDNLHTSKIPTFDEIAEKYIKNEEEAKQDSDDDVMEVEQVADQIVTASDAIDLIYKLNTWLALQNAATHLFACTAKLEKFCISVQSRKFKQKHISS